MDRLTILVLILGSDGLSGRPFIDVGDSLRGSSERPTDVTLHSLEGVAIDNKLFSRVVVT